MFLDAINDLIKSNKSFFELKDNDYCVIRVSRHNTQDNNAVNIFYGFSKSSILGHGTWGDVYSGMEIDNATGVFKKDKVFAIKVLCRNINYDDKIRKEAFLLRCYYQTEDVIISDKFAFIVTEYLEGKSLFNKNTLNLLSKLTIQKRVALITQIVMQVNLWHKKYGIIHRDIHGGNIMIGPEGKQAFLTDMGEAIDPYAPETFVLLNIKKYFRKEFFYKKYAYINPVIFKYKQKIYIFGRSSEHDPKEENLNIWEFNNLLHGAQLKFPETEDEERIAENDLPKELLNEIRNKKYHIRYPNIAHIFYPPEAIRGEFSFETDICMLADVIVQILEVACSQKLSFCPKSKKINRDMTMIIMHKKVCLYEQSLFPILENNLNTFNVASYFLTTMQNNDYRKRPDSAIVLEFFVTLNQMFLNKNDKALVNFYGTKLALIIYRYWGQKKLYCKYDFISHVKLSTFIIKHGRFFSHIIGVLNNEGLLTQNMVNKLQSMAVSLDAESLRKFAFEKIYRQKYQQTFFARSRFGLKRLGQLTMAEIEAYAEDDPGSRTATIYRKLCI